jgi:hypothetical protein
MKTILKYRLSITGEQDVEMPFGSVPLSVHEQKGDICLWVMSDRDNSLGPRKVYIVGTGAPADYVAHSSIMYIGTVVTFDGRAAWHVFLDT